MKTNFKKIIVLFLIILLHSNLYSQESEYGFQNVSRAYKYFKKNKLNKALQELNIAENADFGFCGNAWSEADWGIKYLKSQIYLKQNLFDKSLLEIDKIDGCGFGGDCAKSDSLRVVILIKKFGKEKVSNACRNEKSYIRNYYKNCVRLQDLNYNFCFTYFMTKNSKANNLENLMKINLSFCDAIKNFNFYSLLQ